MKSNTINLGHNLNAFAALDEIDDFAAKAGCDAKYARSLRLLGEEMITMTADTLEGAEGQFWIENQDNRFELHLVAKSDIDEAAKKEFISLSRNKINSKPKGIKSKISALFASLLLGYEDPMIYESTGFVSMGVHNSMATEGMMPMFSMREFEKVEAKDPEPAEMGGVSKSLIDHYADDITVSVKDFWVEMVATSAYKIVRG